MIPIMSPLAEALAPFLESEEALRAGSTLFRQGDPIRHYYVVRSGCVHLVRWGADGTGAVMQRALEGSVLAESSVFASAYHCDAVCLSDCNLARANMARVRAALETDPRF